MSACLRTLQPSAFVLLAAMTLGGCASVFSARAAREVSRDKLHTLADAGTGDHMRYMGSDRNYHYVYDQRPDRQASYKVRASEFELNNTFDVGDDSYVLWPWLIEGKLLGEKPK